MMKIDRALNSNTRMRALTGLNKKEFLNLVPSFREALYKAKLSEYNKKQNDRVRRPGGGKTGDLRTIEEKLFFILFYYKCYPTYEMMGFFYNWNKSNPCKQVKKLSDVLEKALGRKMVLPKRKISSIEEFRGAFPEARDIFVDGTERRIERPGDNDRQKKDYSGKKKCHTKKNIAACDEDKKIGFLGETNDGKNHDLTIVEAEAFLGHIPEDVTSHYDLGFQGIAKDYPDLNAVLPKKKPRGKELSDTDKEQNKQKSRKRILIENAFAGVKRLRIVHDVFRNRRNQFVDQVMLISCGLWNYHLAQI